MLDARTQCKPLGAGQFGGLTAAGLSRHFPAVSSGPHVWIIFFPEDFGKIAPAFPCMFQSELHGVPEPGGSEPGIMQDSQGMPGLDGGRRAGEWCRTGCSQQPGMPAALRPNQSHPSAGSTSQLPKLC